MDKKFIELSEVLAYLDSDYLAHHGIKGMKWGVEHGPPYPLKEGVSARIKRAAKSVKDRVETNRQQKAQKRAAKEQKKAAKKKPTLQDKIDQMSNEELDALTNRLRKENAYLDEYGKKQARKGESFLKKSANLMSDLKTAGDALSNLVNTGKKLGKAFGLTDDSAGFDSYDWRNWRKRKKGETEEQYSKRLSALSNIRQRQQEFKKVEEKERREEEERKKNANKG